jgi:hypothetical protein
MLESSLLLIGIGGECPEDIHLLHQDPLLGNALGLQSSQSDPPSVRFLENFHDPDLEALRLAREQKSFIFPSSQPIQGLQNVQAGVVRQIARLYAQQGQPLRYEPQSIQDATLIESSTRKRP